jgi:hypothetical protein
MSDFIKIPAGAVAEFDEWAAACAAMVPTEEELAQERAYWAEMDRQEAYTDYLAAEAAAAAEEAAREEQAAKEAAAARRKATYRSKRDGLTQDERALLREPTRYTVEEVGPGHWWAAHRDCEAIFAATRVDGCTLAIVSNTGAEYTCRVEDDWSVTCPCEHWKKMREWGHEGLCKHSAVVVAVADFNRAQKAQEPAQAERLAA